MRWQVFYSRPGFLQMLEIPFEPKDERTAREFFELASEDPTVERVELRCNGLIIDSHAKKVVAHAA